MLFKSLIFIGFFFYNDCIADDNTISSLYQDIKSYLLIVCNFNIVSLYEKIIFISEYEDHIEYKFFQLINIGIKYILN